MALAPPVIRARRAGGPYHRRGSARARHPMTSPVRTVNNTRATGDQHPLLRRRPGKGRRDARRSRAAFARAARSQPEALPWTRRHRRRHAPRLAVIPHDRDRPSALEFDAVPGRHRRRRRRRMVAHVGLPKIDLANQPATFSRPTTTGLLRDGPNSTGSSSPTRSIWPRSRLARRRRRSPCDRGRRGHRAAVARSGAAAISGIAAAVAQGRDRGRADRRVRATRPRHKGKLGCRRRGWWTWRR